MILDKIYRLLDFFNTNVKDTHIVKDGYDTGVRATFQGKMYVDKEIFFNRPDVKKVIEGVIKSKELKTHIKLNRK